MNNKTKRKYLAPPKMFPQNGFSHHKWIKGTSGGIGAKISRFLHQQGAIFGLSGTRMVRVEALAQDLRKRVFCFIRATGYAGKTSAAY